MPRLSGLRSASATVTLALGLYLQGPGQDASPVGGRLAAEQAGSRTMPAPANVAAATSESDKQDGLGAMIALSQQLEGRLRYIRADAGNLPSGVVVYQVELEDLVVQVDEELSRQPESLPLWNQRVALLLDLERLYTDNLRREYHRMASL